MERAKPGLGESEFLRHDHRQHRREAGACCAPESSLKKSAQQAAVSDRDVVDT
jgi:hypothetical protein